MLQTSFFVPLFSHRFDTESAAYTVEWGEQMSNGLFNSAVIPLRTATARGKAEQADMAAIHAREDGQNAIKCAQQYQHEIETATPQTNPNQLRPEPFFRGNLPSLRIEVGFFIMIFCFYRQGRQSHALREQEHLRRRRRGLSVPATAATAAAAATLSRPVHGRGGVGHSSAGLQGQRPPSHLPAAATGEAFNSLDGRSLLVTAADAFPAAATTTETIVSVSLSAIVQRHHRTNSPDTIPATAAAISPLFYSRLEFKSLKFGHQQQPIQTKWKLRLRRLPGCIPAAAADKAATTAASTAAAAATFFPIHADVQKYPPAAAEPQHNRPPSDSWRRRR